MRCCHKRLHHLNIGITLPYLDIQKTLACKTVTKIMTQPRFPGWALVKMRQKIVSNTYPQMEKLE
jgi:hypothetical protein